MLSIGPDRYHSLGGPFSSVRDYLRAHRRRFLVGLERQQGIDELKESFLDCLRDFVENHTHNISAAVEDVPIDAMHSDMGLRNTIVCSHTLVDIEAVIDWEIRR